MDMENTTQVNEAQNIPAEPAKNDVAETPVSVQTEPTNTNTSAEQENGSAGQQTPVESKSKIIARGGSSKGHSGYVLVKDENGKRTLKPADEVEKEPEKEKMEESNNADDGKPRIAEQAEEVKEQLEQKPEPYNLDEFSTALANGNVNESRVPDEYKQQYANYKIQQAIEARNQQIKAQQEQREKLNKQLTPEQTQENMKQFLTGLDNEAGKRAAVAIGFTQEDIENIEFMDDDDPKLIQYKLSKEWYRNELITNMQQRAMTENNARQKQAEIYSGITQFITAEKAKEPNFDAIEKLMVQRVDTLPHGEGKRVEAVLTALQNGTITDQQSVALREYYDATRKEYYAKKAGLSNKPKAAPKPPVVEQPGSGQGVARKYVPDYNALRNSNERGRLAWLAEFIKNRDSKSR